MAAARGRRSEELKPHTTSRLLAPAPDRPTHPPLQPQPEREAAWCTNEYSVIDAVNFGVDFEGKKAAICKKHGYDDFASVLIRQIEVVRLLVEDCPAELWDLRLDVSEPIFILFWAMVLGRAPVRCLIGRSIPEVRRLTSPDLVCCSPRSRFDLVVPRSALFATPQTSAPAILPAPRPDLDPISLHFSPTAQ